MGKVIYYTDKTDGNPVYEFIESLQKKQKAKVFRILQYIEIYGLQSVLPHVKKLLGFPLWEIRVLGKDNIRIFYISIEKENVLLLHGFVKKTQKTEKKEISTAMKRLKNFIDR